MKSFIVACLAVLVIGYAAAMTLDRYQVASESAFSSPTGVRI